MGWTLYELARSQGLQERVRKEVQDALDVHSDDTQVEGDVDSDCEAGGGGGDGGSGEPASRRGLRRRSRSQRGMGGEAIANSGSRIGAVPTSESERLELLGACIKETGRVYMKVLLQRMAVRDAEFEGRLIRRGELLCISPGSLALDERLFRKAGQYDPGRWQRGDAGETGGDVDGSTYAQFGLGRHRCLGERLALMAIRNVVVPMAATQFKVELARGQGPAQVDYFGSISAPFPKERVLVTLTAR
ncbi:hypothetical protein HK105_205961 [Polyrhizophydium stewartii]|uniref:Cytochrome P450 n=1 Tax=Polyrhizophydium stewartii TaxID=2732419 RepID=A0ABR4N560_9FUNG